MINLNTFQLRLIKFYILPIFFFGLIVSYNFTYTLSKNFIDNITFKKEVKEIKEIQRKNLKINGIELKKWTVLTESQKEYFLENEKEKLEDKEKFKIKYKSEYITENLNDENIDENYNFILFIQVLFSNFKIGIILIFLIPFIFLYLFYKKYYLTKLKHLEKFYNLPFYLNNLTSNINLNDKEKINFIDKFLKYDEVNNCYLYKTYSITQINIYDKNIIEIEKYLNIENLQVEQNDLTIKLYTKNITKFLEFNENVYENKKMYLGKTIKNEDVNLDLLNLKHTLIIGSSGSGKSVFVQNLLLSIFKNLKYYEKIYLVDFKLVEMSRYKKLHEKIDVVSGIDYFVKIIKELENIMFKRFEKMEKMGLVHYRGSSILMFIDEFRTIQNNGMNKKEKEEMNKIIINIIQKRRRRKIFLIFRGQKRDTENIDSSVISNIMCKICLRTDNSDNIIKTVGTIEEMESLGIKKTEVQKFNKGRLFYKDNDNGVNYLIQSPFFDVQNDKHCRYMLKLLDLNDLEIERKLKRIKFINELNKKFEDFEITEKEYDLKINDYDLNEEKELNKNLINDNNYNNDNIENIDKIEKIEKVVASFKQQKTEKIEILESNDFNDLEKKDLEIKRLELWKNTNNIEDKKEQSQKRKILFQIKKLIENNEIEEVKKLFKNFK